MPGYTLSPLTLAEMESPCCQQKPHTLRMLSPIYLSFHHHFSSWQLSPIPFSRLPYAPGKPKSLKTLSAFFPPELLPHPYSDYTFPNPLPSPTTQPGIFHLWYLDVVLDELSNCQLSKTRPGLSAHDLWAPCHQAPSPTLKSHD